MLNVKDSPYNAAGDGTTNDTEAIQEAIDDAKDAANGVYAGEDDEDAAAAGEVVLLPKGTYLTTAPLKLPPTVTLQGEGTGTLIKSLFSTEPPPPYDIWRGAIEMSPDANSSLLQAAVRDLCIYTNIHCGITYDRTKEVWPAKVYWYSDLTFNDVTTVNNGLFRNDEYPFLTGTSDYLYLGFTNKTPLIRTTGDVLMWTRMKRLGFADQWGSRLQLEWEYSSAAPFGPVSGWSPVTVTAELGGGFWHYGHGGTYMADFGAGWVAGTVNGSASLYWVRVKTTSTVYQSPIAHHIYPGVRAAINQNRFENLWLNCGNWAIFFGLFSYCQNSIFRAIRTPRNNGGCIWVVGNSNYISDCNTEGAARSTAGQDRTDPGQFTMEGDGNTIRDVIAEGGVDQSHPPGRFPWYCFRGQNLHAYNLWVESEGQETIDKDRTDCNVQQMLGAVFDRQVGHMRFENARNVVIDQAQVLPDTSLSESMTVVGDSTVTIHDLWGYKHPGDMDNPRIRWNNFHSESNRGAPLLSNVTSPVTGNLVANGDFLNGTYGWTLSSGSGTTTGAAHGTIVDAPDGRGKELVFDITADTGNGVTVTCTVNIPPGYEGYDGFFGFRADTDGNCRYRRLTRDNGLEGNFENLLNSQSAYRIRRIGWDGSTQNATHTLSWQVVTQGDAINRRLEYDGTAFSAPDFPATILNAAGHHFYLGSDLPVSAIEVNVTGASSGLTRVVEYWDGSAWTAVSNLSDATNSFATTGTNTISFTTPRTETARWKKRTLNGTVDLTPYYWVRFRATAVTTAPTISAPARKRQGKFYLSNVYCVIGQTHNQVPSTQVQQRWGDGRLEISAASVPSTGSWRQGDVVWKTNPSILAGNPGYHLMGWRRITTGTGQTVGTDWAEMRIPARGDVITVSHSGGIYSIDASKGNAFHLNLDGSNRVVTILGAADAQHILIRILRTSAGANTPGFDEMFDFGSLSYTISAVDKVDYISVLHYNNSYHIVDVKTGYPKEPP